LPHDGQDVTHFGDLPNLLRFRPFSKLELFESPAYDFEQDTRESLRQFTFDALAKKQGAHAAVSILNKNSRHFARDFREHLVDKAEVRERIEASYLTTTQLFFANKGADVRFLYPNRAGELSPVPNAVAQEFESPVVQGSVAAC
jgi:hypothetical protein